MRYTFSGHVSTDLNGYNKLLHFFNLAKSYPGKQIEIAFCNISFFDANLSASLLGMIHWLKKYNRNTFWIDFNEIGRTCNVLIRNGFTTMYSGKDYNFSDSRTSTVPLNIFSTKDADKFCNYIETDFLKHRGITDKLLLKEKGYYDKIVKWYTEIFGNVDLHANTTDPIFACGQYYPSRQEFIFSLVDLGEGFLKKINLKETSITTDLGAINWALEGNTTKLDAKGGNSLKKIKGFCLHNNAGFQIITGNAFWFLSGRSITTSNIKNPSPGVTINLIFRY